MGFAAQCLVGTLAAFGLICILKMLCDIIFHRTESVCGKAELYVYVDGQSGEAEQILRQIALARSTYLPGLSMILVDTAAQTSEQGARLAAHYEMAYPDFRAGAARKGNQERAGRTNDSGHGDSNRVSKC